MTETPNRFVLLSNAGTRMYDVIISYSSRDREVAFLIQGELANRNLSVWMDTTVRDGEIFPVALKRQLDQCLMVVALWSKESARSVWVLSDAERAIGAGKLLSVFIEDCDPPLPSQHIRPQNLEGWRGDTSDHRWVRFVDTIRLHQAIHFRTVGRAPNAFAPDDSSLVLLPDVGLALQTVLVIGNNTREGSLIEVVAPPWFEIVRRLQRDPAFAYQMSPRMWEEIVAGAYERAGFEEVILTPRSGDHGRDVIATKRGIGTIRVIDQVKAFNPGRVVTADHVRALLGTLYADDASKGFVTTTSTFAPKLRQDPLISPLVPSRLGLIEGKELIARLRDLAERKAR